MPSITIDYTVDHGKIIQKLATASSVSPKVYIENILKNFAEGQLEGYFIEKIRGKTVDELIALLGEIL
jgi:hypothetical protein